MIYLTGAGGREVGRQGPEDMRLENMGLEDMRLEDMGLEDMRLEVVELEDVSLKSCGCWGSLLLNPLHPRAGEVQSTMPPKSEAVIPIVSLIGRQKWQKKVTGTFAYCPTTTFAYYFLQKKGTGVGMGMMFLMVCVGAVCASPHIKSKHGGNSSTLESAVGVGPIAKGMGDALLSSRPPSNLGKPSSPPSPGNIPN